jgi:hypothetical protein
LGYREAAIMEQNLIFVQQFGCFGHRPLFQSGFLFRSIMAANNSANQGQALLANLTNISNEPKTDAGHCFACQLAIEFAWPTLQPWPPIGCRIDGDGSITTVFACLPLSCLFDLLSKIPDQFVDIPLASAQCSPTSPDFTGLKT